MRPKKDSGTPAMIVFNSQLKGDKSMATGPEGEEDRAVEMTREQKDARIKAAFEAWENRKTYTVDKDGVRKAAAKEDISALWEAMWEACDFSWHGLADAGWARDSFEENAARELKRWRAPLEVLGAGDFATAGHEGVADMLTLQDYWRWSLGVPGFENENRLLTDEELKREGLLVERQGRLYFALHDTESDASEHPTLSAMILARLAAAPGDQGVKKDAPYSRAPARAGLTSSGDNMVAMRRAPMVQRSYMSKQRWRSLATTPRSKARSLATAPRSAVRSLATAPRSSARSLATAPRSSARSLAGKPFSSISS